MGPGVHFGKGRYPGVERRSDYIDMRVVRESASCCGVNLAGAPGGGRLLFGARLFGCGLKGVLQGVDG